jgi:hypothetical protein
MKVRLSIVMLLCAVITMSACTTWIDPNINKDPNNPLDVALPNMLTAIEGNMAYTYGGDLYRYASTLNQHYEGTDRQHLGIYQYTFDQTNTSTMWDNFYTDFLQESNILIGKATANNSPHYRGVGRVINAMSLGMLTDVFGDVPFGESFRGDRNLIPKYESQEAIYARIQGLLDSAIIDLAAATSSQSPGTDDLIFAGDRAKWTRAAWALKARHALHLVKRNPQSAQQALTFLRNGMTANSDNMQFVFGASEDQANPLYQFDRQRNDLRVSPVVRGLLSTLNDPRRSLYVQTRAGSTTQIGAFFGSINSPVPFVTYFEQKFIEAEVQFRAGNPEAAKTAFTDGVRASFQYISLPVAGITSTIATADITAYLAQESVVPAGAITLDRIMEQKFLAMFTQAESFTDVRRTGFPVLRPTLGMQVARRFPYPQNERLYNAANLPAGSESANWLFTRVWWDVQ